MPISEAARADLYTGLAEVLGPDRAETLMGQLPRFDPAEVATKSDLAGLRAATESDLAGLRAATKSDLAELRAATESDLAGLRAATRSDLAELRAATESDLAGLRAATKSDMAELRTELRDGLASVNQRLDRFFLALLVGMFGVVASLISLVFTIG